MQYRLTELWERLITDIKLHDLNVNREELICSTHILCVLVYLYDSYKFPCDIAMDSVSYATSYNRIGLK